MGWLSKKFKQIKKAVKKVPGIKAMQKLHKKGLLTPGADFIKSSSEVVSGKKAEEANKAAEERALAESRASESRARTADVFAQTEGRGQGTLGSIQLGFDDEEEDELMLRQGKSSLQI